LRRAVESKPLAMTSMRGKAY